MEELPVLDLRYDNNTMFSLLFILYNIKKIVLKNLEKFFLNSFDAEYLCIKFLMLTAFSNSFILLHYFGII